MPSYARLLPVTETGFVFLNLFLFIPTLHNQEDGPGANSSLKSALKCSPAEENFHSEIMSHIIKSSSNAQTVL